MYSRHEKLVFIMRYIMLYMFDRFSYLLDLIYYTINHSRIHAITDKIFYYRNYNPDVSPIVIVTDMLKSVEYYDMHGADLVDTTYLSDITVHVMYTDIVTGTIVNRADVLKNVGVIIESEYNTDNTDNTHNIIHALIRYIYRDIMFKTDVIKYTIITTDSEFCTDSMDFIDTQIETSYTLNTNTITLIE